MGHGREGEAGGTRGAPRSYFRCPVHASSAVPPPCTDALLCSALLCSAPHRFYFALAVPPLFPPSFPLSIACARLCIRAASLEKVLKENLGGGVRVAGDAKDALIAVCGEFVALLTAQANELCEAQKKVRVLRRGKR